MPQRNLSDEVVLVTGATSGFGAATARVLAGEGARVILAGRRAERLQDLQKELGENTHALVLDVRDADAIKSAIDNLPEAFQNITALVNNAGLAAGVGKTQDANLDDWQRMIDTNIKGLVTMTRHVLPGMIARDKGYVINIGSIAGQHAYEGSNVYGGSKAFVQQFTLGLRADLLGTKVRATNIAPGLAETEFALVRNAGDAAKAKETYKGAEPLVADDVAEAVRWCLALPEHVNVNFMEIMPTCQSPGGLAVHREA